MYINFRQGIISAQSSNFFLQMVRGKVDINVDIERIDLAFAYGNRNYLFTEPENITGAWGPFTPNIDSYLYWDIDLSTGIRSFGVTTVAPSFGSSLPKNPKYNQHYFDYTDRKMKVWNGVVWQEKLRVFAAILEAGAILKPYPLGSQVNLKDQIHLGYILFDDSGNALRVTDTHGNYYFLTTEDKVHTDLDTDNGYNIDSLLMDGSAYEPIPAYTCVTWKGLTKQVGIATYIDYMRPCIGISVEPSAIGESKKFITKGFLRNYNFWNFTDPPNTPVYVGPNGQITTIIPQNYSIQRIGHLVSNDTIYVDIQPQYLIVNTIAYPTPTPSVTATMSPTPTLTASSTVTATATPTMTVTRTATMTATPTPTATPTISITPSITVSTSQNAVPANFDYAVLRMSWTANNGTDADMRVALSSPPNLVDVGWRRATTDPNAQFTSTDNYYLVWGGDNVTPVGTEAVLINFANIKNDFIGVNPIQIRIRNLWYTTLLDGNIEWTFETYVGGTMEQVGTDFINVGGTLTQSKTIFVNSDLLTTGNVDGQDTAQLAFHLDTNVGELIVLRPAVTPTPTPSVTASNTATPSVTPTLTQTRTVTPTISITPSVTPSITVSATSTPSVTPTISVTVSPSLTPSATPSPSPIGAIMLIDTANGTPQDSDAGGSTTISATIPVTAQAGDLILASVMSKVAPDLDDGHSAFASVTSGFVIMSEAGSSNKDGVTNQVGIQYSTVFSKVATAGDAGTTFSATAKWVGTADPSNAQRLRLNVMVLRSNTGGIILEHSQVLNGYADPKYMNFASVSSTYNQRFGVVVGSVLGGTTDPYITVGDGTWVRRSDTTVTASHRFLVATKSSVSSTDTTGIQGILADSSLDRAEPLISLLFAAYNAPYQTATPTPTISFTPTFTPTNTVTPTISVSVTPTISITPTMTASISVSKTPSPSITPSPTLTQTPTPTPSVTPPPVALISAGVDNTSICGTTIPLVGQVLVGNPSDYTFLWEQLSGPAVVINNPSALSTYFTSTTSNDRTFRLWANKGQSNQTYADVHVFGTPSEIWNRSYSEFKVGNNFSLFTSTNSATGSLFSMQPEFVINNYTGGTISDASNGVQWQLQAYPFIVSSFYMSLDSYNGSTWTSIWSTTNYQTAYPYNVQPVNRIGTYRVTIQLVSNGRIINTVSNLLNGSSATYQIGVAIPSDPIKTYVGQVIRNAQNLTLVKYNPTLIKYYYSDSLGSQASRFTKVPNITVTRTNYTLVKYYYSDSLGSQASRFNTVPAVKFTRSSGSSIGN